MNLRKEYNNKNVVITGGCGFKGSWMALLLSKLGANVSIIGLKQEEKDTAFYQLNIEDKVKVLYEDLRFKLSEEAKKAVVNSDYIFHFAAEAIVSRSVENPAFTFNTNAQGTVQMLELIKNTEHPISFLNVASDRVYAPNNDGHAHIETDPLGGLLDPYSLSKVWQNQLLDCYRNLPDVSSKLKLINARTSNVIGGGDKGYARLITTIEDAHKNNKTVELRNPSFTRQYIFVLDCLCGYLYLAAKGKQNEYNIGSGGETIVSVQKFVETCQKYYPELTWKHTGEKLAINEGKALAVNTDRFHDEFTEITRHIADDIDGVIRRTLEYNTSDNKEEYADRLIEEAISIYSTEHCGK